MNINLSKEFHEQNKIRYEEEFNKLPASFFDETTKSKALDFNFGSLGFEWHLRFTDKGFWSLKQYRGSIEYKGFGFKSLLCYFGDSLKSIQKEVLKFSQEHNISEN